MWAEIAKYYRNNTWVSCLLSPDLSSEMYKS